MDNDELLGLFFTVVVTIFLTSLVVFENITDDCQNFNKFNVAGIQYTCVEVE